MKPALFLDRDGVINHLVKYHYGYDSPQRPDDVTLVAGISALIKAAQSKGFLVIVITNQPGIAKGKMSVSQDNKITLQVKLLLQEDGVCWDGYFVCPHHPEAKLAKYRLRCNCRKPEPGLIFSACEKHKIDLGISWFLGDTATDIEAGKAATVKTALYIHEENEPAKVKAAQNVQADFRLISLTEFIPLLG